MRRVAVGLVLAVVPVLATALLLVPGPVAARAGSDVSAGSDVVRVTGPLRFGSTVRATVPQLASAGMEVRFQWLRDDRPIDGATGQRHQIAVADVGSRLSVQLTASAPGSADTVLVSRPRAAVEHRRAVRRSVTYSVETRGPVSASVSEFARLAQATYDDPRGWRGAGIEFRRVARGGSFTLVLATPDQVPRFSGVCSAMWSCRVGRYVVINQARWQHASPAWNAAGGALRDYRHLVVDHETGHWLGLGHASCPGPGRAAPVMMQQSKGLGGCRFNPFPTLVELGRVS